MHENDAQTPEQKPTPEPEPPTPAAPETPSDPTPAPQAPAKRKGGRPKGSKSKRNSMPSAKRPSRTSKTAPTAAKNETPEHSSDSSSPYPTIQADESSGTGSSDSSNSPTESSQEPSSDQETPLQRELRLKKLRRAVGEKSAMLDGVFKPALAFAAEECSRAGIVEVRHVRVQLALSIAPNGETIPEQNKPAVDAISKAFSEVIAIMFPNADLDHPIVPALATLAGAGMGIGYAIYAQRVRGQPAPRVEYVPPQSPASSEGVSVRVEAPNVPA